MIHPHRALPRQAPFAHNARRADARARPVRPVFVHTPMTRVRHSTFVPYSAAQMYALVNDVAAYPQFLPWCRDAEVLRSDATSMHARLHLKKGPLDASFATINELTPARSIRLKLAEGPFKSLHGEWRFEPTDGGALVSLDLEFEFASRALARVLGAAFRPIADSLVAAFKTRAYAVYGA